MISQISSKRKTNNYKKHIKYFFDNLLSSNKYTIIIILALFTILFVLVLSAITIITNKSQSDTENLSLIWDNFATAINAWWPFNGDGVLLTKEDDQNPNSLIFIISKILIAIFGLLLTSTLIGYISEIISEKFSELQKGKTEVLEEGHIIIIGYDYNNHTLIKELIKAKNNRKILIVDDKDISEIRENLKTNIDVPSNVKIIYRSLNPSNIEDLEKCNIENSYAIVIQPTNDINTLKSVMALKKILKCHPTSSTHIVCAIKNDDYLLNFSNKKDIILSINSLLARIIATSNHETGLSKVLISLFSFNGSEMYLKKIDKYIGLTFGKILYKMYGAVPIGILRNNEYILIPDENEKIKKDDELLYYAESRNSKMFLENTNNEYDVISSCNSNRQNNEKEENILILGYNNKFEMILNSFDKHIKKISIANISKDEALIINRLLSEKTNISSRIIMENININMLSKITEQITHIIILSRDSLSEEQSDIENMLLYLRLNKLRERTNANWTLITELNSDENRELIEDESNDDFIVSSNIMSIMLAQMIEDYRLRQIFIELLSSHGINIVIDDAFKCTIEEEKIADLRVKLLRNGAILLGYILYNNGNKKYIYNPNRNQFVDFEYGDKLILIKKDVM